MLCTTGPGVGPPAASPSNQVAPRPHDSAWHALRSRASFRHSMQVPAMPDARAEHYAGPVPAASRPVALQSTADLLLVTEIFPPIVGGSAQLFECIYSRLAAARVTVLTAATRDSERRSGMTILRTQSAPAWGVIDARSALHHLRAATRLRRLSGRGAVVHCGRILPEGLGAGLAALAAGAPYLCWVHGEELAYIRESRELTALARFVTSRASGFFANSRNTAGLLHAFGVPETHLHVVHPGVDSERFHPAVTGAEQVRRRLAPDGGPLMITIGRLQRRKGHDRAIEALANVRDAVPGLRYAIVGDGEERSRLEALARSLGLQERVVFAGAVAAADLPQYYAAADFFVHPNRQDGNDFEGFGMVFLEAAAAGLPVIAGRSGGVPEAVAEGVTGLLVSGTDAGELGDAIVRLAMSPDLRQQLGTAGRTRAATAFTWERAAAQVWRVHQSVSRP
jgi:phosphatidyl-myo-inositol dimannoside synthase